MQPSGRSRRAEVQTVQAVINSVSVRAVRIRLAGRRRGAAFAHIGRVALGRGTVLQMYDIRIAGALERPRILVVSEVLLYREGVAGGLAQAGRFRVVGAVGASEVLAVLTAEPVDVILLDASELDALEIARALQAHDKAVPVVGFGISCDANSLACAEAGLKGFVGRNGSILDLTQAVERALAGEVLCSSRLAALLCERIASLAGTRPSDDASPLTRREQEIARLVAEGLSNKEIAIELKIGPATVKNHIHSILEKLRVSRRSAISTRLRRQEAY